MKTFRFRLAPVLEHRRRQEEAQAQELARAQRLVMQARSDREVLERILVDERHAFSNAQASGPAGALRNHLAVLQQIRDRLEAATSREDAAAEAVVKRVLAYQEASRDREVLSRLEDRRKGEWRAEWKRREQSEADETALTRHFRARQAEGEA